MSNRSFRFTQEQLSKSDRFHLRTVESRHSMRELLRKYRQIQVLAGTEFAPTSPAEVAAASCRQAENEQEA
jgi:hypothetical protein